MTFVVNRNINVSNVCIVGCAFCGFGQGKRSPDAYEHDEAEFRRRVREAVDYGATEICMQSGIHPDWGLEDYLHWLRVAKDEAPQLHLHAYSPMEIAHMCDIAGLPPVEVFAPPARGRPGLDAGHRGRGAPRRRARAHQPEQAAGRALGGDHRGLAPRPGCARRSTVMFGHIEEPWELAEHMRVIRELQERTGGITEFVPLSFIPFHTLLGRTHGVEEISREENLKHTAVFRLALGRSVAQPPGVWVKMGLDAATEALRWGVNDLGGTLMEENISRLAGSLPRRPPRPARPHRRRAPRRAARPPSARRSTRSAPPPAARRACARTSGQARMRAWPWRAWRAPCPACSRRSSRCSSSPA